MVIILTILLCISVIVNLIFGRAIILLKTIVDETELFINELNFMNGKQLNENVILNKYEHAILISSINANNITDEGFAVWDVSQYEKNRIVGLTTFASAQSIEAGLQRAIQSRPDLYEGMTADELEDIKQQLRGRVGGKPTIAIDVNIYQMKDGTWIWR